MKKYKHPHVEPFLTVHTNGSCHLYGIPSLSLWGFSFFSVCFAPQGVDKENILASSENSRIQSKNPKERSSLQNTIPKGNSNSFDKNKESFVPIFDSVSFSLNDSNGKSVSHKRFTETTLCDVKNTLIPSLIDFLSSNYLSTQGIPTIAFDDSSNKSSFFFKSNSLEKKGASKFSKNSLSNSEFSYPFWNVPHSLSITGDSSSSSPRKIQPQSSTLRIWSKNNLNFLPETDIHSNPFWNGSDLWKFDDQKDTNVSKFKKRFMQDSL